MIKKIFVIVLIVLSIIFTDVSVINADESELKLYATAAVLIDGSNGRILYGKNENQIMPMASTTKIMTLIIALEYGNLNDVVTFSKYAAAQPDVQMNAKTGEQYYLRDLLYVMMMQSYNDVAVCVAEYVADKYTNGKQEADIVKERSTEESKQLIQVFADLMNKKAKTLGCVDTYFITPNGLDAQDDKGEHSTTAYELALICAYAVGKQEVIDICTTRQYSFSEINGKRNISVGTTDRFLDMISGAVGLKTGFTGKAGYCFAGAVKRDEKTLISVVLGSGWPPNKSYKWTDTKILMNYGLNDFFYRKIFIPDEEYVELPVHDGTKEYVITYIPYSLDMLIGEDEEVDIVYSMPEFVNAPVEINQEIGNVNIYIDDKLVKSLPVHAKEEIPEKDFMWCLEYVIKIFLRYA